MTTLQPVVILLALVIISVICFLLHRQQRQNNQTTFSHLLGKRRSRSAPKRIKTDLLATATEGR